jgi:hypothetical protein
MDTTHFSTQDTQKLASLGFNWDETSREFFSDLYGQEMGIFYDSGGISCPFALRQKLYDYEEERYWDEFNYFETLTDLFEFIGK